MLGELDDYAGDRELSNAFVLATICAPFLVPSLVEPDLRPLDANALIEDLLVPLSRQLQLAPPRRRENPTDFARSTTFGPISKATRQANVIGPSRLFPRRAHDL